MMMGAGIWTVGRNKGQAVPAYVLWRSFRQSIGLSAGGTINSGVLKFMAAHCLTRPLLMNDDPAR
jgi:hypothetical protein